MWKSQSSRPTGARRATCPWWFSELERAHTDLATAPPRPVSRGKIAMAKAYWVTAYRSISDAEKLAAYATLAGPAIAPFGGRYLARGNAVAAYEAGLKERIVISEFPSVAQAIAAHDTAAYQEALRALGNAAVRDLRRAKCTERPRFKAWQ